MRRILLLLVLMVCIPVLLGVGLGPGLFSGSGTSGILHPTGATEDSFVWLGENATNTTGTEKGGFKLNYDRELTADHIIDLSDIGFGFSQWDYALVDGEAKGAAGREVCGFATRGQIPETTTKCNASTSLSNKADQYIPIFGEMYVEALLVSVVQNGDMGAVNDKCTVRIEHNPIANAQNIVGLDMSEDTPGAGTDTNAEVAAVDLGPGGVNNCTYYGAQGQDAAIVGGIGTSQWCVKSPQKTYTGGLLMLTIADRESGVDDCTGSMDAIYVGVKYRNVWP